MQENKNFMYKLSSFIVDRRKAFMVFFVIAIIYCLIRISDVNVENDVTKYLPADTETRQGVDIMDNEFEILEFSRFYADVLCERIISDCSHNESVISWWNLSDSKISIHIGCTSVSRFLQIDIGEY